jgi:hemoglobin-like flavoprotein
MREKIFVSYSHKDAIWLDRLREQLGAGIYKEAFEMWSDLDIENGANWKIQIQAAIASSRIALLLVSKHFLASDFIVDDELPSILRHNEFNEAGRPEGLTIWWVPLEKIDKEDLQAAGIANIQAAVASPSRPLGQLKGKEREDAIGKLSSKLMKQLKLLTDVSAGARDQFKLEVAKALASVNTTIEEALAPGDYSILYRAKRLGDEVAVKALFPLPGREWMGRDFIERARSVCKVRNATAIGIRDVVDRATKCVVMEYVNAPTLKEQLNQHEGRLPCSRVVDVLAQLAGVAADLHQIDGKPIIGPIRPSHVHYELVTKKVRISLVHIANETLQSCQQRPTLLLDSDALTSLVPERYFGRKIEPSADQYYLGLLGLELLQGKPPVEVFAFADLETKRKFFDGPRAFFGNLPVKEPTFSFVLTKMLEPAPQNRWTSMSELAEVLRQVAAGIVPAAVKALAVESYKNKLHNNRTFFESFYRGLFRRSEEIRQIFDQRGVTMDQQYKKLDSAVHYLFLFDRSIKLTALDEEAENHRQLGLRAEHFDLFREAFLEALREVEIDDAYSQDAWRAILDPALAFMREKSCDEAVKLGPRNS